MEPTTPIIFIALLASVTMLVLMVLLFVAVYGMAVEGREYFRRENERYAESLWDDEDELA